NGAGIASEHLETIFEQFITIPTDYTATGTGIGLYLSREIIKAHDGTITAQSKGKGKGSTFTIELPRKLD
ncbi:MAG: sensor histidine kinase, partial [Promethearchaeota archaeon]